MIDDACAASGFAARRKEPLFKFRVSHRIQFRRSQVEFFSLAQKTEYTSFADLAEPSDFTLRITFLAEADSLPDHISSRVAGLHGIVENCPN